MTQVALFYALSQVHRHLLLRTLSWCKVSPQLLDGNDGGDCVKSSIDASVRTMFDPLFASVTCLAVLFFR